MNDPRSRARQGVCPRPQPGMTTAMKSDRIRRHAPFWLSILAGIALWEIAGRSTSAAFMVPFSETLVRLWQLVRERRIHHASFSIRRSCS